jgi:hypothetical protein
MKTMKDYLEDGYKNEFEDLPGPESDLIFRFDEDQVKAEFFEVHDSEEGNIIKGSIEFNLPTDSVIDKELLEENMRKLIEEMAETLQNG